MQMEIRFASWTRAGKFRVTFVRTNHISTIEGWEPMIPLPCNSLTEMLREIYIPQKNLLKKKRTSLRFWTFHFSLRTKLFLPEHQYRILSSLLCFLPRKLDNFCLPSRGMKKAFPRSFATIARQESSDEKAAIRLNDPIGWQVSSLITFIHMYIYVATHHQPAFARWCMTNDLVKICRAANTLDKGRGAINAEQYFSRGVRSRGSLLPAKCHPIIPSRY